VDTSEPGSELASSYWLVQASSAGGSSVAVRQTGRRRPYPARSRPRRFREQLPAV